MWSKSEKSSEEPLSCILTGCTYSQFVLWPDSPSWLGTLSLSQQSSELICPEKLEPGNLRACTLLMKVSISLTDLSPFFGTWFHHLQYWNVLLHWTHPLIYDRCSAQCTCDLLAYVRGGQSFAKSYSVQGHDYASRAGKCSIASWSSFLVFCVCCVHMLHIQHIQQISN